MAEKKADGEIILRDGGVEMRSGMNDIMVLSEDGEKGLPVCGEVA